jgi:hypothetical protein
MRFFKNLQWRWPVRLFLLLLVAIPATSPKPVAAATNLAAEWEITFEIRHSKMRAFWIGRVWDYSNGGEGIISDTRRIDISNKCQAFGGPIFGESDVTFDGVNDYVRCQIPNFQAIFYEMAPQLLRCQCYYDGPPYAAADVSPVYSTKAQPVVYHKLLFLDVLRFDTKSLRFPYIWGQEAHTKSERQPIPDQGIVTDPVRVDANNNLGLARLSLEFLNGSIENWQSHLFSSWQSNGFQIWAGNDAPRYTANNSRTGFAKLLAYAGFWDAVDP